MRVRCPQVTIKEMVCILFCTELPTDCADRDLSFFLKNTTLLFMYAYVRDVCATVHIWGVRVVLAALSLPCGS